MLRARSTAVAATDTDFDATPVSLVIQGPDVQALSRYATEIVRRLRREWPDLPESLEDLADLEIADVSAGTSAVGQVVGTQDLPIAGSQCHAAEGDREGDSEPDHPSTQRPPATPPHSGGGHAFFRPSR